MSYEKQPGTSFEQNPDALREAGVERRQEIERSFERGEQTQVEDAERAKHEALEQAAKVERETVHEPVSERPDERRAPLSTKHAADISFKQTMEQTQSEMSAPSRAFSKVIHNKTVEKTSETLSSTIARPNAILSGAIFAFVLTLVIYLIAKNLGYPLSGFESIAAFILGWVVGIVFDFLRVMITGKR